MMYACKIISVPNPRKHTEDNFLKAIQIGTAFQIRRAPSKYYRWIDEADGEKGKQKKSGQ